MGHLGGTVTRIGTLLLLTGWGSIAAQTAGTATGQSKQKASPAAGALTKILEDVYEYRYGAVSAWFIVTDGGVITTDHMAESGLPAFKAAIASVTDKPVRYVIYSHDHADGVTGYRIFADTAKYVSHTRAAAKIAARGNASAPVPTITFDDHMQIELGGKVLDLYYVGRNHADNMIVTLYPARRFLVAIDFVPVNGLPRLSIEDSYPDEWVTSLAWIERNLDFDVLAQGHTPARGTNENVTRTRECVRTASRGKC